MSESTGGFAIPYRFERTASAAELRDKFTDLAPESSTGVTVAVAGRIMLNRPSGKIAFATLRDSSGAVQLFSGAAWTTGFAELSDLPLGSWIGATGEVVTTRTGELSVKVSSWVLLAPVAPGRGFGDKWKGI